jgi:hypothetical protein
MATGSPFGSATRAASGRLFELGVPVCKEHGADLTQLASDLSIYPLSLAYSIRGFLPLAALGVAAAALRASTPPPARWMLAGTLLVFLVLQLTALIGGTNLTPYRSVMPLAAALVPYSLAPLLRFVPGLDTNAQGPGRTCRRRWLVILPLAIVTLRFVEGHQGIVAHRIPPMCNPIVKFDVADVEAFGRWLQREALLPSQLERENWRWPLLFYFDLDSMKWLQWVVLEYSPGNPRLTGATPIDGATPVERVISGLSKRQLLISDRRIAADRLHEVVVIGRYHVYEAHAPSHRAQ